MAKILIIGKSDSPLEQIRGTVGHRAGHQIFWFSAPRANLHRVMSYSIPELAQRRKVLRTLLKPIFLLSALNKIEPDIVHVHYAQTGLMVYPLLRFHPLIVTVMGGDILPDQGYRGFSALFVRMLLNHADCITSKSDYMDAALNKIGDFQNKTRRITWGVDLNRFKADVELNPTREKWSIPPDDLVFFDSRLARRFYNKHIILEAFANYLHEGGPSATLIVSELFADESYLSELRQQARDLRVKDKVRFVGNIPHHEMPAFYALADITISIPPSDGLPQTIYEAFACGSFLILGKLPQYMGVVEDGVTACLVPVGDSHALTDALFWATKNPDIRMRAKEMGMAYVKSHADFDRQAELVNQIYSELLRKKSFR